MNDEKRITDLDEIKRREIKILDTFVEFCKKNNLKYYLAYGTLLGAVRHKGFIPWDDDIDVIMPRDDYEKLLALWDNTQRYRVMECKLDPNYIYPFAKISDSHTYLQEFDVLEDCKMGLYVDVFPYDCVGQDKKQAKKFIKRCAFMEKLRIYSMLSFDKIKSEDSKKNLGRKVLWKILRKTGPARISRYQDKVSRKYFGQKGKWKGLLCTQYPEREILSAEVYEDSIEIVFEGKKYNAPANYDHMLKKLYGDYMKLPPKEEQVLKHNFKVWEIEETK